MAGKQPRPDRPDQSLQRHLERRSRWRGSDSDDWISQPITLPSSSSAITLTFWWWVTPDVTATLHDTLTVSLLPAKGPPIILDNTRNNTSPDLFWVEDTLDLSAYAGKTETLRFDASNDDVAQAEFFVDDDLSKPASRRALTSTCPCCAAEAARGGGAGKDQATDKVTSPPTHPIKWPARSRTCTTPSRPRPLPVRMSDQMVMLPGGGVG